MEIDSKKQNIKIDNFAKELAVALRRILDINNFNSVELPKVVFEPIPQIKRETGDQNG